MRRAPLVEFLFATGKVLLAVAIGLPIAVYFLQDRMLFHPQPLADSRRAAISKRFPAVREIFMDSEKQKLHAWHVAGEPLVIYFGGNAEDVSGMLEDAVARAPGVGWLIVSYRGYGASEGSPSEASISADALQWYDYAVKNLGSKNVIAFGRSLGSGAAVFLASERKITSVVLVAPFDSLVEVAKHHYPWLPVSLLLKHRFDSIGRAPRIQAPLLCLVAERDQIIPAERARKLFDAWSGPRQWVALQEAGHNTTDRHPLFWPSIERFLQQRAR